MRADSTYISAPVRAGLRPRLPILFAYLFPVLPFIFLHVDGDTPITPGKSNTYAPLRRPIVLVIGVSLFRPLLRKVRAPRATQNRKSRSSPGPRSQGRHTSYRSPQCRWQFSTVPPSPEAWRNLQACYDRYIPTSTTCAAATGGRTYGERPYAESISGSVE